MNLIVTILGGMWLVRIVANLLTYVHLWFVKEYRFDRMWIHLHTSQGKRLMFAPWRLPPASPKTIVLVGSCLAVSGASLALLSWSWWIKFLIIDVLSFPLTASAVLLLKLPTVVYHELLIYKAMEKIRRHKPMKVIGITGSYGKTSTKEYLATILGTRFKVLKTVASKNSPVAIAEGILQRLLPEHEIFVVEMGAYKEGEIAQMSRMVKPQIGIVTAINPQHQDLFGSLEHTMRAKHELVAGLCGKRIAIFNADDNRVQKMAIWAKQDDIIIWGFSRRNITIRGAARMFFAGNITSDLQGLRFICRSNDKQLPVSVKLLGEHQVSNILAAIAAGVAAGLSLEDAVNGAENVVPVKKVLELLTGVHGSIFIDDTFNNNPDAAKAALDVLALGKGKKVLVFQPMIELGRYAESSHREVGAHAGQICDWIILTNSNWSKEFISGVRSVSKTVPVDVLSSQKATTLIRTSLKKGDTVLFKGKESAHILELLNNG